jgi:phosphoenolpyruvate carboxylase
LSQLLSQSASRVPVSPELQSRINEYEMLLPAARSVAPARHDQMPYRVFFAQVSERLRQTYDLQASRYERVEQFRADLMLAAQSLLANRGASAGYQLVRRLLLRVDTFGFHLATLDLKQRADVHHRVIGQGMDDPQWLRRSRSERTSLLADMLQRNVGPVAPLDATSRRTLAVFEAATQCRARYGNRAIGSYVVAGAEGADDLLAPLVLARWAGVDDRRSGTVGMDFAPLFESGESLRAAASIMQEVLSNADYREHLAARSIPQPLFIGYSEAGRDGGYLAMRMAAFDAQRDLSETFARAQQPVSIRHARGGSTARGGSRLDELIRATPSETIDGRLHITEQGEIISQHYGLRTNALRSLERAFGVLGLATLARRRGTAKTERPEHHQLVNGLAAHSRGVWRALLVDDLEFNDFFRAITPIDVIERMQIGARSVWDCAHAASGAMAIRATPWMFAWSQARYFLPGWYGAGSALHHSIAAQGLPQLRAAYGEWPFFALVINDIEAQLARTDLAIAECYGELASPGLRRYTALLRDEYQRARDAVLAVKDESDLLDGDRTQQRAIQLRNPYVDPMNLMQVDLLRRWRASAREDEDLFQALLASVSGIAQGLQTTG